MAEIKTETSVINNPNLKAYYRFESGALTTDSSGNGNTLTAISDPAESASGKYGGCVDLDSTDAYSITDHSSIKPTGVFTVGGWINGAAGAATRYLWSSWINSASKYYGFLLGMYATEYPFFIVAKGTGLVDGTDYKTITGSTVALDGTWHWLVATWDGTNINLYVDGASIATPVAAFNCVYGLSVYNRIGCRNDTGADAGFLTGYMDDVFLLNGTALNAQQISDIYNNRSSKFFNVIN